LRGDLLKTHLKNDISLKDKENGRQENSNQTLESGRKMEEE
jgi:hypothetical protein